MWLSLAFLLGASAPSASLTTIVAARPESLAVDGTVVDARTREPLQGARIFVAIGRMTIGAVRVVPEQAPRPTAVTGIDGRFQLELGGVATLIVERAGYATADRDITASDTSVVIELQPLDRLTRAQTLERLTVTAVRAGTEAPVAQTTLDRSRLTRDYTGQDVPLTLRQAPSVTAYAESGSLLNYSYFRIRGVDQSRINITLDGVPLNEPEDQQIYFSDFPDFTSSIESVQLQRGVGTSSYGQAAFGGAVNFASPSLTGAPRLTSLELGAGSFGTRRATVTAQSGPLGRHDRFAAYARASGMRSDGYREGASTSSNGGFGSASYIGDRDIVKLTLATGLERNGQAYQPVPLDELRTNPRANPLAGVGDHYRESFATLNYTRLVSATMSAGVTAYGFLTGGFYDYPSGVPGPPLRYRSASRWAGAIAASHTVLGRLTLDAGAHAETYSKDHEFDGREDLQYPAYSNTSYKNEVSAFAKANVALGSLSLFGDLQLRGAEFRYQPTAGYGLTDASQRWTFVNPRVGATLRASSRVTVFASFGTSGREPTRSDLFAGSDDVTPEDAPALLPLTRVRPEHVNDIETGVQLALGSVSLAVNAYDMRFRDEIARTGATTPLGYDIRANVGRSYRRGLELDGSWRITTTFDLGASVAVSRNRIRSYSDEASQVTYSGVAPILTPSLVAGHRASWRATRTLTLNGDGRYQGRTFLAPTGDRSLTTPPFYALDGGLTVNVGRHILLIQGRNLLDRHALPSGDVSGGVARYFILAPRSVDVSIRLLP